MFVVSWLLHVCVLSDIDTDLFHTQLSVDKYWICEYVCVCVMGFLRTGNSVSVCIDVISNYF